MIGVENVDAMASTMRCWVARIHSGAPQSRLPIRWSAQERMISSKKLHSPQSLCFFFSVAQSLRRPGETNKVRYLLLSVCCCAVAPYLSNGSGRRTKVRQNMEYRVVADGIDGVDRKGSRRARGNLPRLIFMGNLEA